MVKCLNIGKNIGQPIYRSISNRNALATHYRDDIAIELEPVNMVNRFHRKTERA